MHVNGHRMRYLENGGMLCTECFYSIHYPEDRDPEIGKLLYLYVYGAMKGVDCEASTPEFSGMDIAVTQPAPFHDRITSSASHNAFQSKDLNRMTRK